MTINAVQQVRKMRGGAQSQLMLGSDNNLYVVKFQNNPQHIRVLANELIATRLAETVGLTVPQCEVINVDSWLIESTPELYFEVGLGRERCRAGWQFGSRLVGGFMPGQLMDYLPEEMLLEVRNLNEFAGMLAFDKWTCNVDGRQAVYSKRIRERRYHATFIDQGYCFNAGEWKFADAPLRGIFGRRSVYSTVTGWESFEPWLGQIEGVAADTLWSIVQAVPPEWYGDDRLELERLVAGLIKRRGLVKELIWHFRESDREPFPHWKEGTRTRSRLMQRSSVDKQARMVHL